MSDAVGISVFIFKRANHAGDPGFGRQLVYLFIYLLKSVLFSMLGTHSLITRTLVGN